MQKLDIQEALAYLQPHAQYETDGYQEARTNAEIQRVGDVSIASLDGAYEQGTHNRDMLRSFVKDVLPVDVGLDGISTDDEWLAQLSVNLSVWGAFGVNNVKKGHFILGQVDPPGHFNMFTPVLLQNYAFTSTAELGNLGLKAFLSRNKNQNLSGEELQQLYDVASERRAPGKLMVTSRGTPSAYIPRAIRLTSYDQLVPDKVMKKYKVLEHMARLAIIFDASEKYEELLEARLENATDGPRHSLLLQK